LSKIGFPPQGRYGVVRSADIGTPVRPTLTTTSINNVTVQTTVSPTNLTRNATQE